MPKPEMIILRREIMKTKIRMTSFKIMAAKWSFCLFMFKPPIITKRIATMSWKNRHKDKDKKKGKASSIRCSNVIVGYLKFMLILQY